MHEFYELVLCAVTLCIRGDLLALRSMLALLFVIFLALAFRIVKVHRQQPVHHRVRVAPDRRGEMSVELEIQAVVADVVS